VDLSEGKDIKILTVLDWLKKKLERYKSNLEDHTEVNFRGKWYASVHWITILEDIKATGVSRP
jgi:hypothetical protein